MSEADLLSAGTALIDTHAHLDDERFAGEIDEILERAEEAGIRQILTVGESPETFEATIALAEKYPQLFAAIGIHPQQADKGTPEALARIEQLARAHAKVVAIGEIGFDYYYEYAPRPVQEEVFRAQLRMAQSLELPFIVHDRDAHDDTLRVLREEAQGHKLRGVLHCFSGDAAFAEGCLELGLHLAFGGTLTYPKNAGLRAVAATVPEDRLLLETDCPYLAPQKRRGKRNEPAFMRLTAEKLAEERGITLEELAAITSRNAAELFGMGQTARIAYVIRDALYLNITNRCSNACVFCAKFHGYTIGENFLRLEREPSVDEIVAAVGDPRAYREVVFCGYGEPLLRLDTVREVAIRLQQMHSDVRIRINTDGQANLVYGRDILPDLEGLIDAVSVSLNAADAASYQQVTRTPFGEKGFAGVLDFLRTAPRFIPDVTASVVTYPGVDVEAARALAQKLGVKFRVRPYLDRKN